MGLQSYSGCICISMYKPRKITFEIAATTTTKTIYPIFAITGSMNYTICIKLKEAMARMAEPMLAFIAWLPCHLF